MPYLAELQWRSGARFGWAGGIAFAHQVLALTAMLLISWLAWASYRLRTMRPALFRVNAMAVGLIVMQALVGGAVVLSRHDLWTTLAHAALMALLFVCLADAACQVLPQPR